MDELRERCIAALGSMRFPVHQAGNVDTVLIGRRAQPLVDAILAEIAAAGYVLVERERAEKLQLVGSAAYFWWHGLSDAEAEHMRQIMLRRVQKLTYADVDDFPALEGGE